MQKYRQDFKPIKELLREAVARAAPPNAAMARTGTPYAAPAIDRPASDTRQAKLREAWQQYWRGSAVQGTPLLFESGRLVVFASSACWGNEIRHRAPDLQATLTARGVPITRVEVKTRPAMTAATV